MSERAPEDRDPDVVPYASSTTPGSGRTPIILVVAAWLFVGVPAAWGVSQTFMKSLALFQGQQQPTPTTPAAAPTTNGTLTAPTTVPSNPYPANAPGTTQPSGLAP